MVNHVVLGVGIMGDGGGDGSGRGKGGGRSRGGDAGGRWCRVNGIARGIDHKRHGEGMCCAA